MEQQRCPACGTKVNGGEAKFCPACGETLGPVGNGVARKETKGRRGLLLIAGGLLALTVGFSLLAGGEEPAPTPPPEQLPVTTDVPQTEEEPDEADSSLILTAVHVEGASPVCAGDTVKGALVSAEEGTLAFEIFSKTYPLQITSEEGQPIEASFVSEVVEVFVVLETSSLLNPRGVFDYRDYETEIAVSGSIEATPPTDN